MFGYNTLAYLNSGRTARRRVRASQDPLNLYVGDERAVVTALVPGFGSDDVEITIEDRDLSIKARATKGDSNEVTDADTVLLRERSEGDFARVVRLPYNIEADQVTAKVKDGILRVELPRAEADKPRAIKITAA